MACWPRCQWLHLMLSATVSAHAVPHFAALRVTNSQLASAVRLCLHAPAGTHMTTLMCHRRSYHSILRLTRARARRQFEGEIAGYAGEDPLEPWLRYIRTLQDECPTDQAEQFEVLEVSGGASVGVCARAAQ
jgi:hypothetical protein